MNLKQLHQHLSRDASYRRQYENLGDIVALAMNSLAIRKELGISQAALASDIGVSTFSISRFETLSGTVPREVVSAIVRRFKAPLQQRGVPVKDWLVGTSQPQHGVGMRQPVGESITRSGRMALLGNREGSKSHKATAA
jgi:hypothetical protein